MARSSTLLANSTSISNRLFMAQRKVIVLILAFFILLLFLTAFVAHQHVKNNPELLDNITDKLGNIGYPSLKPTTDKD